MSWFPVRFFLTVVNLLQFTHQRLEPLDAPTFTCAHARAYTHTHTHTHTTHTHSSSESRWRSHRFQKRTCFFGGGFSSRCPAERRAAAAARHQVSGGLRTARARGFGGSSARDATGIQPLFNRTRCGNDSHRGQALSCMRRSTGA